MGATGLIRQIMISTYVNIRMLYPICNPIPLGCYIKSMAMTQEPIDWRYRFHIFLAYFLGLNFREYP
jgi:hypothetical protein